MQVTRALAMIAALATMPIVSGCSTLNRRTTTVESGGEVVGSPKPSPVTPADNSTLPAGATLTATLDQALGTKISQAGDQFSATVSNSLYARDGSLVVPAGAKIEGHVTALDPSDNATDPALIRLNFDTLRFNGRSYPLGAEIVRSSPVQSGQPNTQRTKQIVIGGAVGAALGGIIGRGDLDKIVIGGAMGAALGSIISLGTEVNATLPAGSQMTVRATQPTILR